MLQDIQSGDGESDDEEERIKNVAGVAYTRQQMEFRFGYFLLIFIEDLHEILPEIWLFL